MRILLIESDKEYTKKFKSWIQSLNFQVVSVHTLDQTVEEINNNPFDLALINPVSPYFTPDELINRLRPLPGRPDIIILSSLNSRKLELQMRDFGILFYLVTPIDIYMFKNILSHLSSKYKKT